jgi:hypothetical protein
VREFCGARSEKPRRDKDLRQFKEYSTQRRSCWVRSTVSREATAAARVSCLGKLRFSEDGHEQPRTLRA